jgi:threonine/homoserine/homoserine lactone efflux protein
MPSLFPAWPLLTAFVFASLVLAITPGPAVFYIVTRTVAQGRQAGLASVAGVAFGNLGNALGASIGLAALFAISSMAFTLVKYAGAAYLIYLGIQALRARETEMQALQFGTANLGRIFRDGFVVALLNPKTTIFFAAFLPQFMDSATAPMQQSLALGVLFVVIASVTDSIYTLAASMLAPAVTQLRGARTFGRYLIASAFIGLGVFTAVAGSRGK